MEYIHQRHAIFKRTFLRRLAILSITKFSYTRAMNPRFNIIVIFSFITCKCDCVCVSIHTHTHNCTYTHCKQPYSNKTNAVCNTISVVLLYRHCRETRKDGHVVQCVVPFVVRIATRGKRHTITRRFSIIIHFEYDLIRFQDRNVKEKKSTDNCTQKKKQRVS